MPIICNNCGQKVPDDSAFCPKCGTKVTVVRCSSCGAVLTADAKFCPGCGIPVGTSVIPAVPDIPKEQISQDTEVREPDQTAAEDTPRHSQPRFDWKYWSVSILRGYGTTRNT